MLSKKMAFLLIRLITVFALALVVSPVIAGNFKVTITGPELNTQSTLVFYDPNATDDSNTSDIDESTESRVPLIITSDETLPINFPTGIKLYVEDREGFPLAATDYTITISDDASYLLKTPKVRRLNVDITRVTNSWTVGKIILTIPAFTTPDPTVAKEDKKSEQVTHTILLMERIDSRC